MADLGVLWQSSKANCVVFDMQPEDLKCKQSTQRQTRKGWKPSLSIRRSRIFVYLQIPAPSPFYAMIQRTLRHRKHVSPIVRVARRLSQPSAWFLYQHLEHKVVTASQSVREPRLWWLCSNTLFSDPLLLGWPYLALIHHGYCANTAGWGGGDQLFHQHEKADIMIKDECK